MRNLFGRRHIMSEPTPEFIAPAPVAESSETVTPTETVTSTETVEPAHVGRFSEVLNKFEDLVGRLETAVPKVEPLVNGVVGFTEPGLLPLLEKVEALIQRFEPQVNKVESLANDAVPAVADVVTSGEELAASGEAVFRG